MSRRRQSPDGFTNALVSPWVTNSSPPPAVNWNRIDDFGYLAQHLTAVESKYVASQYYSAAAHYSFWNGGSWRNWIAS